MRALHTVTAPAADRTMPPDKQPTVERVLNGQTHTVRLELAPWVHELFIDVFHTLDTDPRLKAMFIAAIVGDAQRAERRMQRANIAHEITGRLAKGGLTTHDMDPVQADDLAEALTEAATDAAVCTHDSYRQDCQNLTDGDYCTDHDGSN